MSKHVSWFDQPTEGVVRWAICSQCSEYKRDTFKKGLCKQCRPREYHIECRECGQVLNGPVAMKSGLCVGCTKPISISEHQRSTIWDNL